MRSGYEPIKDDKGNGPSTWSSFLALFSPSRTETESNNTVTYQQQAKAETNEKNIFSSNSKNENASLARNKK